MDYTREQRWIVQSLLSLQLFSFNNHYFYLPNKISSTHDWLRVWEAFPWALRALTSLKRVSSIFNQTNLVSIQTWSVECFSVQAPITAGLQPFINTWQLNFRFIHDEPIYLSLIFQSCMEFHIFNTNIWLKFSNKVFDSNTSQLLGNMVIFTVLRLKSSHFPLEKLDV